MTNIIKSDIYRLGKSKLLYSVLLLTIIIAFLLTTLIRQDMRLGISIFGNLIAFTRVEDVIRIGLIYHNGLGIFVAILLSVFIGQEYQWKTWQHKWNTNKSRVNIYLSKVILTSTMSAAIFLAFQVIVLFGSIQTIYISTYEYTATIISGVFIYAALGAVICMLSMLIKNNTTSLIACIGYVLLSETIATTIGSIINFSETGTRVIEWFIRHSVYGMATIVTSTTVTWSIMLAVIINALVIILATTGIGLVIFKRYEL